MGRRNTLALAGYDYGDDERSELGELLGRLITDWGWSQTQLAALSGVSSSHISRILHDGANASPETLDALAEALGVHAGLLHRASAAHLGLRVTETPDDPDFQVIMAAWPYLPPPVKAAHRASIEKFSATHRRLTSQNGGAE